MNKTATIVACFILTAFATTANAASYSYSSISTSVSGGSSASAVVNSIVGGTNSHSEVWINGRLVERTDSPATENTAPILRETSRGVIDRMRTEGTNAPLQAGPSSEASVQQNVRTVNGSTSAQIHVYRKENGNVVEDRLIPLSPQDAGRSYLYRSAINSGNSSASVEVRTILASSSQAAVIRNLTGVAGLPWLLHVPFFSQHGLGVASTQAEERLLSTQDERRLPFDNLFDRIFYMFR